MKRINLATNILFYPYLTALFMRYYPAIQEEVEGTWKLQSTKNS